MAKEIARLELYFELFGDVVDLRGIDTDACVMASALSLFEYGKVPRVLVDYCGSIAGLEYHNMALRILERNIGKDQLIRESNSS